MKLGGKTPTAERLEWNLSEASLLQKGFFPLKEKTVFHIKTSKAHTGCLEL